MRHHPLYGNYFYQHIIPGEEENSNTEQRERMKIALHMAINDLQEPAKTYLLEKYVEKRTYAYIGAKYHKNQSTIFRSVKSTIKHLKKVLKYVN